MIVIISFGFDQLQIFPVTRAWPTIPIFQFDSNFRFFYFLVDFIFYFYSISGFSTVFCSIFGFTEFHDIFRLRKEPISSHLCMHGYVRMSVLVLHFDRSQLFLHFSFLRVVVSLYDLTT